ncbi:hypothetical protein QR680_003239 [Steinernema hermaphroditum]|uniref:Innexin n=1 Tax=Steinernema hermaphroditum TaxID=289476 RepID=A0AA39H6X4_9BILA|nr:hypothetical protein QR680_003239 [Steinernema hermaphroditum]
MTSPQLGAINSVNSLIDKVLKQPKGDVADRLNSRVTVGLLAVSAAVLLSTHFWGSPINCWSPAQFTSTWIEFVNQYCYVHGTYFVPFDEELPYDDKDRRKVPINYYQWVPYILACQALLFYLPRLVWKSLCVFSGFDLMGAIGFVNRSWAEIKKSPHSFAGRMEVFEKHVAVYLADSLILGRQKNGHLIGVYYLFATVLQCLNAWCQWLWLNSVLQSHVPTTWGFSVVTDIVQGIGWQETGHFPRITHCDFTRRRPASVQMDTVLCVLHLNIYYEKLFIFLWFWMLFVAIVSTINTIWWSLTLCRKTANKTVRGYFMLTDSMGAHKPPKMTKFLDELGNDGLFVMEQITLNIGRVPASYLTHAMSVELERRQALGGSEYDETSPLYEKAEKVAV